MAGDCRPIDIYRKTVELIDGGSSFAVAVILRAEGSTPQEVGVRAIIDPAGKISGTVGGGSVEAEVQRRAVKACRSARPTVFDFRLDSASASDSGAICGGTMRILIDPTVAKDRECYAQAADALTRRGRGVLVTSVRTGTHPKVTVQWFPQENLPSATDFPGADAVRSCLARQTPQLLVEDLQQPDTRLELLVEPVVPRPLLLIAGGGHVGQALARQAILVGFDVTVIDDRPEFANPALFPEGVTTLCGDIPAEIAASPVTGDTYIVIVTRGHEFDAEALQACIGAPAAYIGMIGSKRKVALIRERLIECGRATQEQFDRVFAPIGLNIGAVTVPEIATSIAAELIAVRRNAGACSGQGEMVLR